METISFFDIWPPRNSIVPNISYIIQPNFAYCRKHSLSDRFLAVNPVTKIISFLTILLQRDCSFMETISFLDIWPPKNSIVLDMSYII